MTGMEPVPFHRATIGEEEIQGALASLRSGWLTTGPRVTEFEERFAALVGAPAALAVNSCTAGLHVALAALGIGRGDAVITSAMTFCSTAHVIEHVGARTILVDVAPGSLNIDPERVRDCLTKARRHGSPRIRAIMPVHLYGQPCEMDDILSIAREFDLAVVEDAAHALPAAYKARPVGSITLQEAPFQLASFSFYATKNITTGEGGMLTGPERLLELARPLVLHGMSRDAWRRYDAGGSWHYDVTSAGFKYNMTDLQASLGLQQLRRLPELQARRREIWSHYDKALGGLGGLRTPRIPSHLEHALHLYVIQVESTDLDRDTLIAKLAARGIATSVHFIPLHLHEYYRTKYGYAPSDFPVAFQAYQRIVSLPLFPDLTDAQLQRVTEAVVDLVRR